MSLGERRDIVGRNRAEAEKDAADRDAIVTHLRRALRRERAEILRNLDRLQEAEVEQDGKRFVLRTPTSGGAGKLFQGLGVALPPNIRDATPAIAEAS